MKRAYIGLATALLLAGYACTGKNSNAGLTKPSIRNETQLLPAFKDVLGKVDSLKNKIADMKTANNVGYIEGCVNIGDLGNKELFEQHTYGVDVVVFQKFPNRPMHVAGTYRKTDLENEIGLSFDSIFSELASREVKDKYVELNGFEERTGSLLHKFAFDYIK